MRPRGWTPRSAWRSLPAESSQRRDRAVLRAKRSAKPRGNSFRLALENFHEWNGMGRGHVLRGHLYSRSFQGFELLLFAGRQHNVAQLLDAPGAMVNTTQDDATHRPHALREAVHPGNVARNEN